MKAYKILIILALIFAFWSSSSGAFSWATPFAIIIGIIIALGGVLALIFNFISKYINFNLKINPLFGITVIIVLGIYLSAWLVDDKTQVLVPKNYSKNYLIIIYEVKGAKRIWPSITKFPRTYTLEFPNTGVLTSPKKSDTAHFTFSMCEVLEENGDLYLPNQDTRYFYSKSETYHGFDIDILYLDESTKSNDDLKFDFLSQIDFTKYEKIIVN